MNIYEKSATFDQIVEQAAAGDGFALRNLCEEIGEYTLFRIKFMLGSRMSEMDAEDISQEVLIRICKNICTLRNPKAFRKWLNSIIANETSTYIKKNLRKEIVLNIDDYFENIPDESSDISPEEYVSFNERHTIVMDILSKLPDRQRQAIMYRYYDDYSLSEVSELMQITQQGTSKNLKNALAKIKEELEKVPSTALFGVISILSVETILKETLYAESINFVPSNSEWLQMALNHCEQYFVAGASIAGTASATAATAETAATVKSATVSTTALSTTKTIIATIAITCVLLVASLAAFLVLSCDVESEDIQIDGHIIFSGGIDLGEDYKHINPEYAKLYTNIHAYILEWLITTEYDEIILRSGDGSNLEIITINPNEIGFDGVFYVIFQVKNEFDTVFRIGNSFVIQS